MRRMDRAVEGLQVGGRQGILRGLLPAVALLVLCMPMLVARQALERRSEAFVQRLEVIKQEQRPAAARRKAAMSVHYSDAALAQLGRQVGLVNRDWSRLLGSLVPEGSSVRLLAVNVDPAAGMVRVSGTGARAADANAYSALLEQRGVAHDVRLLSLEPVGGRVTFEVVARWRD